MKTRLDRFNESLRAAEPERLAAIFLTLSQIHGDFARFLGEYLSPEDLMGLPPKYGIR